MGITLGKIKLKNVYACRTSQVFDMLVDIGNGSTK